MIYCWISSILGGTNITDVLAGETLYRSVASGCPQVGVLFPALWSLVVDKLIGVVT